MWDLVSICRLGAVDLVTAPAAQLATVTALPGLVNP